MRQPRFSAVAAVASIAFLAMGTSVGQILVEDFDGVTETGGGNIVNGVGFNEIMNIDDGIVGETAFAGTVGNASVNPASAFGDADAGVMGSGAAVVDVANVLFNLFGETFASATGTGGGVVFAGTAIPGGFNFQGSIDDGVDNLGVFVGAGPTTVIQDDVIAEVVLGSPNFARLSVSNVVVNSDDWFAGFQSDVSALPGFQLFANADFESGLDGWGVDSAGFNVLTEPNNQRSGTFALKMFGRFVGAENFSSVSQEFPAQPGQTWELRAFAQTLTGDSLAGGNELIVRIEYLDTNGLVIGSTEAVGLDSTSTLDTYLELPVQTLVAPAGTATARGAILFKQDATNSGGAAFIDDVEFGIIAGPGAPSLADFSINADVRGIASLAGEVQGTIQLRLEDTDGDRIFFDVLSNGALQSIGGPLSTGTDAAIDGTPTPGAFNPRSPSFRLVLVFNNDTGTDWGTGGELQVESLSVSNSDPAGSDYFAGLFFDELSTSFIDVADLYLTGDLLGSVAGGGYQLRLEAFRSFQTEFDVNFDTVAGDSTVVFDNVNVGNGEEFSEIGDWDSGIEGEGAFGGVSGGSDFFDDFGGANPLPGGIFAEGVVGGGNGGGGAGQLIVRNVNIAGGWFAGLRFANQQLASSDLSQVVLTADIRGIADAGRGETLGAIQLRIEDGDGDRLFFDITNPTGSFESIGGPLSTATFGGSFSSPGNGQFDLDSPSYTVVVSFLDEVATWGFGGTIVVDNLFLTPADGTVEVGRATFTGSTDGANFDSVGGLLNTSVTNFGNPFFDFEDTTGQSVFTTGGGETAPWAPNLSNFNGGIFGTFGGAAINNGATFGTCETCGVGNSRAAFIEVDDVPTNGGGAFAVGFIRDVGIDFSKPLNEISLTADMRGLANGGSANGTYFLRIEDGDITVLSFTATADGTYQTVGGTLDTATLEQIESGDGIFNTNQSTYTIAYGFVTSDSNWGQGARVEIDNLAATGIDLSVADTLTVTATFDNPLATYGTDATLTVDNLVFTPAFNADNNTTIDLRDFAEFQLCASGSNPLVSGCEGANLDEDANEFVDSSDLDVFTLSFTGLE